MTKSLSKPPVNAASPDAKVEERLRPGLETYRRKRDPGKTNEPFSAERKLSTGQTRSGRFVVHLHQATRTHYDLRLQVGGSLQSFAVPKGPSLDPEQKHLAVHTEDHPLEYLEFEAVIPKGNYGAGAMIAWDIGVVRYLESSAEEGLEKGKLDFQLWGFKLKGRFALVHTGKRRSAEQNNQWLLIKKADAFSSDRDLSLDSRSIFSSMTVDELAESTRVASRLEELAVGLGAREGSLPDFKRFEPMLCSLEGAELDEPNRLYELKLDGVRIVAEKQRDVVSLRYRNGRSATGNYPEVVRAVRSLAPETLVLDGEIVTLDERGRPSFEKLAPRIHAQRPLDVQKLRSEVPVQYVVFDVITLGGKNLMNLELGQRKRLLDALLPGAGILRKLDYFVGQGQSLMSFCEAHGLEGVVAKTESSAYRPGPRRTLDWVKIKTQRDDDFVVIGWVPGKGSRGELGSLCVASYGADGLRFRGRVGSGIDRKAQDHILADLKRLQIATWPAKGEVPDDLSEARFVKPELVAQVRYASFTEEGRLRAPVFLGMRPDRNPADCRATPPEEWLETQEQAEEARDSEPIGPSDRQVNITNRNKVFWPDEGYTKGNLCDYYAAMAKVMLPFLEDRPVVLVRYPDGINGKNFYQWNVPHGTPPWIRTADLVSEDPSDPPDAKKTVFLLDYPESLVHIANLGCIPLHVLACREKSREACDFLTLDFDVGERPFEDAVRLALSLKELLDQVGLRGFPKTSGQKGLHVLIPLGKGVPFEAAKLMVELLGRWLLTRHPEVATMERRITKRGAKVLIDIGQTGRSRTIVAPYSVRAYPAATVSTPLEWEEVHLGLDPRSFTMLTVPSRVEEMGDPYAGIFTHTPNLTEAFRLIEAKFKRA